MKEIIDCGLLRLRQLLKLWDFEIKAIIRQKHDLLVSLFLCRIICHKIVNPYILNVPIILTFGGLVSSCKNHIAFIKTTRTFEQQHAYV